MFLYKRAIGSENLKKAAELISTANLLPKTSLESLVKINPDFQRIAASGLLPRWHDLVCLAAVGSAFQAIPAKLPESDWKGIGNAIKYQMNHWQSGSFKLMTTFCDYFCKLSRETDLAPDLIVGGWVWVNLARSPQASPELKQLAVSLRSAEVLGFLILDIFGHWWDENHAREFSISNITSSSFPRVSPVAFVDSLLRRGRASP